MTLTIIAIALCVRAVVAVFAAVDAYMHRRKSARRQREVLGMLGNSVSTQKRMLDAFNKTDL